MEIPKSFEFSQSNLKDYLACRKRFWLRHIQGVVWPAQVSDSPLQYEQEMLLGKRFHRLVQQQLLGLPVQELEAHASADENLYTWWQSFNQRMFPRLQGERHVETRLSALMNQARVIAVLDLVLLTPENRLMIYDWKTSQRKPQRRFLENDLQTRIYSCLLVLAGAHLNHGQAVSCDQVEMVYWFAGQPDQPERFPYSQEQFESDLGYVQKLIAEIRSLPPEGFTMTEDTQVCKPCVYRSLCDRGVIAADLGDVDTTAETEPVLGLDLDLDQIAEIHF